jgi:ribosome-associated toxin RatA of RatAB toxin-antitoxin module
MADVSKTVLVPYSAHRMFDLVNKCEDYPAFLPWCAGGRILEQNGNTLSAELLIDFKGIKQSFSTRNVNIPGERIEMRLLDGPFESLEGLWLFSALAEDACKVEFRLDYHFKNSLIEKVIGPVFVHITSTFVDAFVSRAETIYTD